MNSFEDKLKKSLGESEPFDPEQSRNQWKIVSDQFNSRMKKSMLISMVYLIAGMVVFLLGIFAFQVSHSTKSLIGWAVVMIIAYETTVLIKLWYWVVNNKLSILREIKQLHLQLAVSSEEGRPLNLPQVDDKPFQFEGLRKGYSYIIIAIGLIIGVAFAFIFSEDSFIGQQEDHWKFISAETIQVHSTLRMTSWPNRQGPVSIELPYEEGTIDAVQIENNAVNFEQSGSGQYRFFIQDPNLLFTEELQVQWTLPVRALEKEDLGYRVRLATLIPVRSYKLVASVEPDSGLTLGKGKSISQTVPFRSRSKQPKRVFGTCVISVRKEN